MENKVEQCTAICKSILFTITGQKSALNIHSRYNMGSVSGKTIILKPFETIFLFFRNRIEPVNVFYKDVKNLFNELIDKDEVHKLKVFLDLKNEGSRITIEPDSFSLTRKSEKSSIKRLIFPIREMGEISFPWLYELRGNNIASVDDDGDITYYKINEIMLKGDNSASSTFTIRDENIKQTRAIGINGDFPKWMGDRIGEIVVLSENETEFISNLYNEDTVSLVYRDLVKSGLILKTGFKYGCNFRAYLGTMEEHSDFLVHVVKFKTEWYEISRAVRVAASVRKNMVFAGFIDGKIIYLQVKRIKSILEMNVKD
jgi:tRNA-intron endonuclease